MELLPALICYVKVRINLPIQRGIDAANSLSDSHAQRRLCLGVASNLTVNMDRSRSIVKVDEHRYPCYGALLLNFSSP